MPRELLEYYDISKSTVYHPHDPIASVFSIMEYFLGFSDPSAMPISQAQSINIAYVVLHQTGQFPLASREWNHKTLNLKTWISFKKHFCTAHQKLRDTTALLAQDLVVHHTNRLFGCHIWNPRSSCRKFPDNFPAKNSTDPKTTEKLPQTNKLLTQSQPLTQPNKKCCNRSTSWFRLCRCKLTMMVDVEGGGKEDNIGVVVNQIVVKHIWHSIFGPIDFVLIKDLTAEPLQRVVKSLILKAIIWKAVTKILPTPDNRGRYIWLTLVL